MMVIRDTDTSLEASQTVLNKVALSVDSMEILNEEHDPLTGVDDAEECVLLLSTMPNGCLGYQKRFFDLHRLDVPLWIVLLLNDDPFVRNQVESCFHSDGIRRCLFTAASKTNWGQLSKDIESVSRIRPFHALLYSIRPYSGKRSLAALLSAYLPEWTFETAEESAAIGEFPASGAGHILIVGQTLRDLYSVSQPNSIAPFYILTMPDKHVQTYLRRESLPSLLLSRLPSSLDWSEETARTHFFYISPLYERWRREGIDPALDHEFLLWDDFGLPCPRSACTKERIHDFLRQFDQCEALAKALKHTVTKEEGM